MSYSGLVRKTLPKELLAEMPNHLLMKDYTKRTCVIIDIYSQQDLERNNEVSI